LGEGSDILDQPRFRRLQPPLARNVAYILGFKQALNFIESSLIDKNLLFERFGDVTSLLETVRQPYYSASAEEPLFFVR
jgi:hypothetical protein